MKILPKAFGAVNNYFGIKNTSDKIMFHSFVGFVSLFSWIVVHAN